MRGYMTRSKASGTPVTPTKSTKTLFVYSKKSHDDPTRGVITFTDHDQQQLKVPRFLNDTIMSFFMQYYLDHHVTDDVKKSIHVFNSFFFSKIKSIKQKEELSYTQMSRWLKGVKIFDKDFLIMPICENDHWVLVVVCYIRNEKSKIPAKDLPDDELYDPAVFVLNSWTGYAPSVKKILSQFLKYQWHKEKHEIRSFPIHAAKTWGIRLIYPKLPQQKNNYNCGAFVLNYFYCFLMNPRKAYLSMFRQRDMSKWFEENDINVLQERKRMAEVIRIQISEWNGTDQDNTKKMKESQETVECSPSQSSSSSLDIVEESAVRTRRSVIHIN